MSVDISIHGTQSVTLHTYHGESTTWTTLKVQHRVYNYVTHKHEVHTTEFTLYHDSDSDSDPVQIDLRKFEGFIQQPQLVQKPGSRIMSEQYKAMTPEQVKRVADVVWKIHKILFAEEYGLGTEPDAYPDKSDKEVLEMIGEWIEKDLIGGPLKEACIPED